MARIRSIHPGAPSEEDVATMSWQARLTWAYLPCHADREGRLKDAPFTLKLAILPTDSVDMDAVLRELSERRHIIRYEVDGRRYIQIRSFSRYQTPHVRETPSEIPPPHVQTSPRQTLAVLGPERAMLSTPDPDPDPSPDVDPDRDRAPRAPAPAIPGGAWSAFDWYQRFARLWGEKYGRFYGQGEGDSKAIAALGDFLASMPLDERTAAQLLATEMLAEYLDDASPGRVKARHPWKWFVEGFNGLRAPKAMVASKGPGPPRDTRHGHARAEDQKHTKTGEVEV